MTDIQQQLIRILGRRLFGTGEAAAITAAGEALTEADWDALLSEARHHTVFPLVYAWMKETVPEKIPAGRRAEYEQLAMASLAANVRNRHEHFELHRLLTAHEIPYVILKGMASARCYPVPTERTMGDVDFLVRPERRELVDALLMAEGCGKAPDAEGHDYHWAYKKGLVRLELHWAPPGVPKRNNAAVKAYLADMLERAEAVEETDGTWMAPSAFHHGLVLLLHTAAHLTSGGIGLRHLCDWLVFENRLTDEDFCATFREALQRCGLWVFAQALSQIGVRYFGCEARAWCAEADGALCRMLLEDILSGGNFGRKDAKRSREMKLIRNVATRKAGTGNVLYNAAVSVWEKAKRDYPLFRKAPVLLPAGFLLESVQYVLDVLRGRKVNVFGRAVFSEAMERREIYAKLKLFEER